MRSVLAEADAWGSTAGSTAGSCCPACCVHSSVADAVPSMALPAGWARRTARLQLQACQWRHARSCASRWPSVAVAVVPRSVAGAVVVRMTTRRRRGTRVTGGGSWGVLQCMSVVWTCLHALWTAGGCGPNGAHCWRTLLCCSVLPAYTRLCQCGRHRSCMCAAMLPVTATWQTAVPMVSPAAATRHLCVDLTCLPCSPQVVRHQPP
jgi:hypothetical protein